MTRSMFDSELILPGVITEIVNDYVAGYDTSEFGTTDAVTIIGTAFNGPVGVPVPVFSPEYAKYMFGEAFDSLNRREASLVPEIYDAWNRGCRTIYAVRVSGKDMFKDFELAIESKLKLRVSGQFPCNENKKCFMLYDAQQGAGSAGVIRIYKPADRTTMQEKLQGVVNNVNSILVSEINLSANGLSKSDRLIDLINLVNNLEKNNVLTLSIVNEDGIVMTEADKEIQQLNIGDIFPGIYTICRDKVGEKIKAKTLIEVVETTPEDGKFTNYEGFKDAIWRKLIVNTDVKQPYPLGATSFADFKASIIDLAVDKNYDFLKKVGMIDNLAVMDEIDYEEVELDAFDLYCKLGKGFVQNAKIKKLVKNGKEYFKVVKPDDNDPKKIEGIEDGIYSILENHKSDFLVLAGISAETDITKALPKKDAFNVIDPGVISLDHMPIERKNEQGIFEAEENLGTILSAHCKVDEKDFSHNVNYDITIKNVDEFQHIQEVLNQEHIISNLYKGHVNKDDKKLENLFLRIPVISSLELNNVFEGVNDDQLALVIDQSVNNNNDQGTLAVFNKKDKMFHEVDEDILGFKLNDDNNNVIEPRLLVQIHQQLLVFDHIENGKYLLNEFPIGEIENDKGEVERQAGFIVANNGTEANVYYIPPQADVEGVNVSILSALRTKDGLILTDDDNEDGDYDQGIDCILTYKLDANSITPLISLKDLAEKKLEEDEFTVVCMEHDLPNISKDSKFPNETFIGVYSNEIAFNSREEMVEMLNKNDLLSKKFEFECETLESVLDELPAHLNGSALKRKEKIQPDENAYIPYSTTDNFARHLAQHCLYTQLKTYPTHGMIGCSKLAGVNLSTIAQRVDDICNFDFDLYAKKDNGNYMLDANNEPYPLGRCLSITFLQYTVPAGVTSSNSTYNYVSNGAAGYAGMVSTLPIERSSTNQPIDINEISYELSNYQLGRLNNKGIVCAKNTTNNGVVIVDGITQAPTTSAYRRLSTSKTINAVDKVLRVAIEPYIGLVDSLTTRNSMNTSIKSALDTLKGIIINDYKFKIYTDASGGNLGVIRVDYVIVPFNEIREVRNRVEISDAI